MNPASTPLADPASEARAQRADARRNREAIIAAAKAVFARHGAGAGMDDIARRAKLGVGTLYRHFPTKEALIQALVADRFMQIAQFVREGIEDPDPWNGFASSLWRGAELGAKDRAVSQLFADRPPGSLAPESELMEAAHVLVRRAQEAGVLRPDFRAEDIPVLMCGVMNAMHQMSPDGRHAGPWRRHLTVILDGLRARPDLEPLPE